MMQPRFPDPLGGARELTYITPKRKRLTEYEAVTCYTQPNVDGGGLQECGDFRLRPDGRPLWDVEASAIRCADWFAYRDPNQQWQRPYYVLQAQAEKSIDRATETAAATGMLATINPTWLADGLLGALFPYSHVEFALFRALNIAAREAMSDLVTSILVFTAADKLRHAQAISILGLDLENALDDFDASGGKTVWLEDPVWQPLRRAAEEIVAIEDWMELVVAVFAAFEPLVGEPLRRLVFTSVAATNHDPITPVIVSTAMSDWQRNGTAVHDLLTFVGTDSTHGSANASTVERWTHTWTERFRPVAETLFVALADRFGQPDLPERAKVAAETEIARVLPATSGAA